MKILHFNPPGKHVFAKLNEVNPKRIDTDMPWHNKLYQRWAWFPVITSEGWIWGSRYYSFTTIQWGDGLHSGYYDVLVFRTTEVLKAVDLINAFYSRPRRRRGKQA